MGVRATITPQPRIDAMLTSPAGAQHLRTTYRGTIEIVVEKGIRMVRHGDLENISLWVPDTHTYSSQPLTISLTTSLERFEITRDMISPVGISASSATAHPATDQTTRFRLGIALSIFAEPLPARVSYVLDVVAGTDSITD